MKRVYSALSVLSLFGVLLPSMASAQFFGTDLFRNVGEAVNTAQQSLTCEVEGSVKVSGLLNNVVTYKIHKNSNYVKLNATYSVEIRSNRPGVLPVPIIYKAGGATTFAKGDGYIIMQGANEKSFTYAIKDNPSVTVVAKVDGKECKTKMLTTVKPSINVNPSLQPPTVNNGSNDSKVEINPALENVDLSGNVQINPNVKIPTVTPVVPIQTQECRVIIDAVRKDDDETILAGAIRFENLKDGTYNYTIQGYRNDKPSAVTKFEGSYTTKGDRALGVVMNSDGKGFKFNYDSDAPTDGYVLTATLGNVDCEALLVQSPLKAQNPPQNGENQQPSVPEEVAPSTDVAPGVEVVGLDEEGKAQAEDLNLISEGEVQGVQNNDERQNDVALTQTNTTGNSVAENKWNSSDYAIVGLLSAIFVSACGYVVMKYKGML